MAVAKAIEKLAREIAGHQTSFIALELARSAAQAQFDLALIRQIKATFMDQILTPPSAAAPQVRLAIPELLKLDRYERRALARRERAIRSLLSI